MKFTKFLISTLLLVFFLGAPINSSSIIPITGGINPNPPLPESNPAEIVVNRNFKELLGDYLEGFEVALISFETFLQNNHFQADEFPAGVYAENLFAIEIVQQPGGAFQYVPAQRGLAAQFAAAKDYGSIGLLAHNYLAGEKFFDLSLGNNIQIVYSAGKYDEYRIIEIREFQALSPNSAYSNFRDLSNGKLYSSTELFEMIYNRDGHVIFQVCITQGTNYNWGRHFVIAEPVSD